MWRKLHSMRAVVWCQSNLICCTIQADAVAVTEVRILPFLTSVGHVVHKTCIFIHSNDLCHWSLSARRYLILQFAGHEVIQVEVAPVVALRVPQQFFRCPEYLSCAHPRPRRQARAGSKAQP